MAAVRTQTRLVHKLSIKGQFILVILCNIMHLFSIGNNIVKVPLSSNFSGENGVLLSVLSHSVMSDSLQSFGL